MSVSARFCSLLMSGMICTGCATTPKVAEVIEESSRSPWSARIASIRGLLSPARSKALIERLENTSGSTDVLERQTAVMEAVSGNPFNKGNKATLLIDGPATYAAMFKAINGARDQIYLESYIFEDVKDPVTGQGLIDLLVQKQAAGVPVCLVYDSVGSIGTPADVFNRLRAGGVQVVEFNPINPLVAHGRWRLTHRDHRKVLVVDGTIAITGGVNISEIYSRGVAGVEKEDEGQITWRDTDVRIEGPVVVEFEKLFRDTWRREKGPALAGPVSPPPPVEKGDAVIGVFGSTPGELNRITFIMYVSALEFADKYAHITTAYFVPERQMLRALSDAAGRGVDVRLILPSSSDSWLVVNAGRYYYDELLQAGVKLCEHRKAVLHAKTAVIDGVWSTIGSTNMDSLSFAKNDELNAIILGRPFALEMEKMFTRDLNECDQILPKQWRERSWWRKFEEWFAHLFADWL